jgi:hypothetical protein
MKNQKWAWSLALAVSLLCVLPANASLTTFQTFTGAGVNVNTAGWGSVSNVGTISINAVPTGSTILGVYLYTSTYNNASMTGIGVTIDGVSTGFTSLGTTAPCCTLTAGRADLTSTALATDIAGGATSFAISETSSLQDGEALVVVYKDPAVSDISTVGILDGFSAVGGDNSTISFSSPLNPAASGFFAEMRIGDGFSCCSQTSTIAVNGTTITNNAGNNDDSVDGSPQNGNLITMGGSNDPFSPMLPSYAADHERYNLIPQINNGDTSIGIHTVNPSGDDNIFLEVFAVSGAATISSGVPEPASIFLFGTLLAGVGLRLRRRKA